MKKIIATLLIILMPAFVAAQNNQSRPVIFRHVTIIDVKRGVAESDMTVIVTGNRIAAVGKSRRIKLAKDAQVVDARGKFLIPGLWNMHVHFGDDDFDKNHTLRLYIASGITGIRIMDGEPVYYQWRDEARNGSLLAPRMVVASRVIGFGDLSNLSPEKTRAEVGRAKREGADFIKVHDNLARESYFALIGEAKRLKINVEGHVPVSMTAAEASAAGQKSIEHFTGLGEAEIDAQKADAVIAVLKKNRTWICPTIIMRSNYASLDSAQLAADWRLNYVKPSWKNRWLNMSKDAAKTPPEEWNKRRETVRREKALVGKMARAGVGILAGTDDANPYVFPGFSLHDELALLVEAGLTPKQALQTATINPAKFFNKPGFTGTIERGRIADLVLLEANPLEDIRNTKKIAAVIADGRYFSEEDLRKILSDAVAAAAAVKKSAGN